MRNLAITLLLIAVTTSTANAKTRFGSNKNSKLNKNDKEYRQDVEKMEDIIDEMDTEEQIDFMIDHLEKEEEAEKRQSAFQNITPESGEVITPNQEGNELIMEETASEGTDEWDKRPNLNAKDREDSMTEEEWLEYYDENLAVSGADEERIAEL